MFLRNRSSFEAALARAPLSERFAIGAVVVRSAHRIEGDRLVPCEEPLASQPTDPPDLSRRALWFGVSVTAAGDVYGPRSAPFVAAASLSVGAEARHLAIFGERRWRRTLSGELAPSEPAPFERQALSFSLAYGGVIDVPPGLFPGTELPFPGGRIGYALNEGGVGFYLDKASAEGGLLPCFERAEQRIARWDDRPEPGGFVPCPELVGLRIKPQGAAASWGEGSEVTRKAQIEAAIATSFRAAHHAPGYLIFDDVPPGTPVRLQGVGRRALRFEAPKAPARVSVRRGKSVEEAPPALWSLHVDADRETVSCAHGYTFRYEMDRAPSWIVVEGSTS